MQDLGEGPSGVRRNVGRPDGVQTRLLSLTEEFATVRLPRASWESLTGTGSVGGAGALQPRSRLTLRTQSLDRAAATRLVRAATAGAVSRTNAGGQVQRHRGKRVVFSFMSGCDMEQSIFLIFTKNRKFSKHIVCKQWKIKQKLFNYQIHHDG